MSLYLSFLALLVFTFFEDGALDCDVSHCKGPFKIKHAETPPPSVGIHPFETILHYYPSTMSAFLLERWVYTAYCYTGPETDPRSGCVKSTIPLVPNITEAIDWVGRKKCQIGEVCGIKGPCWGDNANKCKKKEMGVWVENRDFSFLNEEYGFFAYHTCNMDWACHLKQTEFPITVGAWGHDPIPAVLLPNGTIFPLLKEANGFYSDNEKMVLFPVVPGYVAETVNISCVNATTPLCQVITGPDDFLNTIFRPMTPSLYVYRNAYFVLSHQEKRGLFMNDHVKVSKKVGAAASIQDILEVNDEIELSTAKLYQDAIILRDEFHQLSDLVVTMLGSLAKIDDDLIGNLKGVRAKTKWFNPDLFNLCPCSELPPFNLSNCNRDFIFSDGRIVPRANKTTVRCIDYSPGSIVDYWPIHDNPLVMVKLHTANPLGISRDYEGWSWFADQKSKILDTISLTESTGDPSTPLGQVLSIPSSLLTLSSLGAPGMLVWNVALTGVCVFLLVRR